MRTLFLIAAATALLCACSPGASKEPAETNALQLKEETEGIERAKEAMLDSINTVNMKQHIIDSMNAVAASQAEETRGGAHHLAHHEAPVPVATHPAPVNSAKTQPAVSSNPPAPATNTTTTKKKGLNNAAKGSLIGLGTGAAAGAVIDKDHRGQGAILGGVIGAVGGAIGGAVIDKHKKKKEAEADSAAAAR